MGKAVKLKMTERQEEELAEGLRRAKLILGKIPDQEIVRAARKDRS